MSRDATSVETDALMRRAIESFRQGQAREAAVFLQQVLRRSPRDPNALNLAALIHAGQGRLELAEQTLRRCIAAAPDYAEAHNNLGNVHAAGRDYRAALASYTRAVEIDSRHALAHYNRGNALRALGRLDESIEAYETALGLQPNSFDIRVNLGNARREADQLDQAEALYREALKLRPDVPEVLLNLGNVLRLKGDLEQARGHYQALLALRPDHGQGRLSLGLVALEEGRREDAARQIESAQALPGVPRNEALSALAQLRAAQDRIPEAVEAAFAAINSSGNTPRDFLVLASLLAQHNAREKADEIFSRGFAQFGNRPPQLLGAMLANRRYLCDWRDWEPLLSRLIAQVRAGGRSAVNPFAALAVPGLGGRDQLLIARAYARQFAPWSRRAAAPRARRRPTDGRLRVGYLSADFHEHATAYLMASVFEGHDRERFEVFAYSFGKDDQSPMRQRLVRAFEHFADIRGYPHGEAAERVREDGIDILVDLKGYTRHARPAILALRPAPVQVNWLGYPGTLGMPEVDYIVVDPVLVGPDEAPLYEEKPAYLPDSYAPVDPRRRVARTPGRAEADLPEHAFVFCSFNNPYKLTPELFRLWCGLLGAVPDSVLWLYTDNDTVTAHLRQAARDHGTDPERLVFAPKLPQAEHLARIPLADLFLDTLPCNAHTTASDALWMGLPVLTCRGETFASRVAASLLTAAGLPELITDSLDDYRALALRLAGEPSEIAALRAKLAAAKDTAPYFDCNRFTRNLEALYRRMWQRHENGEPPALLPPVAV